MSAERRHSFRCKSASEESPIKGVLHTRRGDLIVRLDNRSSGGYGVVLPSGSDSHVNNGEEIAFTVGDGSSLVRVVHQSEAADGMLIGLEILRELPSHLSKNYARRKQREATKASSSSSISFVMLFACLVLIAMHIPWTLLYASLQRGDLPQQMVNDVRDTGSQLFMATESDDRETQLANTYLQLDQLRTRNVASRLNLTASQQQDISHIVQETSQAMQTIFQHRDQMGDAQWIEVGLQLLHSSAKRIEATLTQEQQARWNQLMSNPAAESGAVENPYAR